MSSLDIVVQDGEGEYSTIDQTRPVHHLDGGVGAAGEKGEDEGENQKQQAESVQKETNRSREGEFGGQEGLVS